MPTHCSVSVSETQLQMCLTVSPIGAVVGVGFLLFFLRRMYLRKGRSVYVDTVCLWVSVQPNLRRIVQTTVILCYLVESKYVGKISIYGDGPAEKIP